VVSITTRPVAIGLIIALACLTAAQRFPGKPADRIADEANILSPQDQDQIRRDSDEFLGIHGAPIVVATIPSLQAEQADNLTLNQYTDKLFDHWRIGTKQSNFSVLVVVSRGDRKGQIQVGAAWNHQMDQEAAHITRDALTPNITKGLYSQGIVETTDWFAKINPKVTPDEGPDSIPVVIRERWIPIACFTFFLTILVVLLVRRRTSRKGQIETAEDEPMR
jgi:uncharacterized membrane protein YgcG